ncbi:MAG: DUF481 domain-containing protein [Acidobacteriota bacterium]
MVDRSWSLAVRNDRDAGAFCRWALVVLLVGASVVPAHAQGAGPVGPAGGATLVQQVQTAPPPGVTAVRATIGATWLSGQTNTVGVSASGFVAYSTKRMELFRVDVSTSYAKFKPYAKGPSFVVADSNRISFTYFKPARPRVSFFSTGGWRRDVILGLNRRVWGEAGLGYNAIFNQRANLIFGASAAIGMESRGLGPNTRVQDVGVLQMLMARPTAQLMVEQAFEWRRYVGDRKDEAWVFRAGFMAPVSKYVGLQVSYKYTYDELRPFGVPDYQAEFMAGVQINFATTPPQAAPTK